MSTTAGRFQPLVGYGILSRVHGNGTEPDIASEPGWIVAEDRGDRLILRAGGTWVLAAIADLDTKLARLSFTRAAKAAIDLTEIERLDTAGAWLLHRTRKQLREHRMEADYAAAKPAHAAILERIAAGDRVQDLEREEISPLVAMLERVIIGTTTVERVARARQTDLDTVIAAFDTALGGVLKQVVIWTLRTPSQKGE